MSRAGLERRLRKQIQPPMLVLLDAGQKAREDRRRRTVVGEDEDAPLILSLADAAILPGR